MHKTNNTSKQSHLTKEQQQSLDKSMQDTDLSYLSAIAFEQFNVSDEEIEKLNTKIDKKIKGGSGTFNTIFISVLCGLLIGISIFFVIFQKSKNHPSVYQSVEEEKTEHKLENNIAAIDTVFPKIETKEIEHYHTVANHVEKINTPEILETLPSKPLNLTLPEKEEEEDIVFQFTANAPVVFIHNLKVTNYRMYYFKNNYAIDLNANTGVPAQYGSKADIETAYLHKSNSYLAHKIIKQAMRFFSSKNITNCIEELTMLYDFNHDDANAQFYLGMCYYQLGKYAIAKNFFQKNLDNINNIFHQESEFYQALCLLNLNQTDEAFKQLEYIANNKGFYSERAKETIHKHSK
jgi:tetratricopeptide (TPR) repeat protein